VRRILGVRREGAEGGNARGEGRQQSPGGEAQCRSQPIPNLTVANEVLFGSPAGAR